MTETTDCTGRPQRTESHAPSHTTPGAGADPAAVTLASMTEAHLNAAHALSKAAGWPHRREDWANALALSQGVVALCGGAVVGTGMCTRFDGRARLSLIIVAAQMRGRGLGRRIVTELIACGGELPMSLTATQDGYPLYRKLGFETATGVAQYQGILRTPGPAPQHPDIRPVAAGEMGAIFDMDRRATGTGRAALLKALAARGQFWRADAGYICRVPFGRGLVLGPLVAADLATAQALLATAAAGCAGAFLRVDTNPALGMVPMLTAHGLRKVDEGRVMHRGAAPLTQGMTAFALASQAYG